MGKLVAAARPVKAGAVAAASTARAAGSGPKASTGDKGRAAAKGPDGSGADAGTGGGANGGNKVRFLAGESCLNHSKSRKEYVCCTQEEEKRSLSIKER